LLHGIGVKYEDIRTGRVCLQDACWTVRQRTINRVGIIGLSSSREAAESSQDQAVIEGCFHRDLQNSCFYNVCAFGKVC